MLPIGSRQHRSWKVKGEYIIKSTTAGMGNLIKTQMNGLVKGLDQNQNNDFRVFGYTSFSFHSPHPPDTATVVGWRDQK